MEAIITDSPASAASTDEQAARKLRNELAYFTGTENYFRHQLVRKFIYTDGVRHFAENAGGGAYWFLDLVASQPSVIRMAQTDGFATVHLDVEGTNARVVIAEDASTEEVDGVVKTSYEGVMHDQKIPFTDCPPGRWKFFLAINEFDGQRLVTMLLPSEY